MSTAGLAGGGKIWAHRTHGRPRPHSYLLCFGVTISLAAIFCPAALEAQLARRCQVDLRAGMRAVVEDTPIATGNPTNQMSDGYALALAGSCSVTGGLRAGGSLEANGGGRLNLYQLLVRSGLVLFGRSGEAGSAELSLWGNAGWTYTGGTGDALLLAVVNTRAIEQENSGPTLGAELQGGLQLLQLVKAAGELGLAGLIP